MLLLPIKCAFSGSRTTEQRLFSISGANWGFRNLGAWFTRLSMPILQMLKGGQMDLSFEQQLELYRRQDLSDGARLDVAFLHRSFCIAGLPLRKPREDMQPFVRHDDTFA